MRMLFRTFGHWELVIIDSSCRRDYFPISACRNVFDRDGFCHAAPSAEGGFDLHKSRLDDGDQVIHDRIGNVFVEDSLVTEALQVELQTFQLDAFFVGSVGDSECPEIWLASLRADRGELGSHNSDFVVAGWKLVFESFQKRAKV